jgi:RNA polymerase sigma factor (sigma-70 family)
MLSPIEKEEFINRIIAENSRQLHSIARKYAPPDEVMDLYQDFVYELWESVDRFEGRSSPGTWACAIALNKAHAFVRNKSFREKALHNHQKNIPSQQPGGRGEDQILREFSQSLPELDCRILMHYMAGLSYRQIAEETGIPETTLRSKILRLKDLFKKRYI